MSDTTPALNVPLLEATMARILAEPQSWSQSFVAIEAECGTTFCFAGHAALLAGCSYSSDWRYFSDADGEAIEPLGYSQRALGLTDAEAHALFFNFTKDRDELHRHVKDLIGSRTA